MNLPPRITRAFIRANRDKIFIYGKSLIDMHDSDDTKNECEGEPNAYGITVCRCFDLKEEERYFPPKDYELVKLLIKKDIVDASQVTREVIILPGLGEGKSLMKEKSPELYDFMMKAIKEWLD